MGRGDVKVRLLGDLSDLTSALGEGASQIGDFASGVAGRAGIALGAAGAAGGALFVERFDDALDFGVTSDRIAAQLNLSDEAAALAADSAASLYANAWGESVDEVSAAIASVAQNDLVDLENASQATVETITAGVLDISNAFDEDFGSASRAAGQLIRNGLAGDATEALDLITAGFQGGANRADDLLDTLNEYAPSFARLGLDGATAIGLISQGLDAGAFNADKIGDAFNEFEIRATDMSDGSIAAFQAMGFEAREVATTIAEGGPAAAAATSEILSALGRMEDPIARNAAGVALFGSMWEDLGEDVILSLNPAEAAITDFEGATERMGDTLNDNLRTKIDTLIRSGLMAMTSAMTDHVIPVAEQVIDTFNEDGLSGVFDLVSEAVSDAVPVVLDELQEMGEKIIDWVADTAPEVAAQLVDWGKEFVEWVGPQISPMLQELGRLVGVLLTWLVENIDDIVVQLAEWGAAFVAWVAPMIPPMLAEAANLLGQLIAWMAIDALPKLVAELAGWALAFGQWLADAGIEIIRQMPGFIQNVTTAATRAGQEALAEFGRWISQLPGDFYDWGREAGLELVRGVIDGLKNLPGAITDALPGNIGGSIADRLTPATEAPKSIGGFTAQDVGGQAFIADVPVEPTPTIVNVTNNFGAGTDPIEAGRAVEEVLYRFEQAGGQIRIQQDAAGVITLS